MPDDFTWPSAPGWRTRYSLEFLDQMQSPGWRARRAEVVGMLRTLLDSPLEALHSERLLRDHHGLRSARFGWRFRLLFKLCGECRLHGDQARFPLACCLGEDQTAPPDNTINILYLSDHYADTPGGFELDERPDLGT